ncbi:Dos2 protein [Saccharomycopsis crataegensis]|uniref:Dos2 protein n=1 Tax=Saccharomycopsis crataegensis TaxID=43959 RepID=A0AAV5QHD0_9ASCO|nr:Dos2 protein [Saccharomycopsis crataegensis]
MDFITDPVLAATTARSANNSSETLTGPPQSSSTAPSSKVSNAQLNQKTNEEFGKFEDKIEETYNLVQQTTSSWGSSFSGWVTKVKLPESFVETQRKLETLAGDVVAQGKKFAEKGSEQLENLSKQLNESTIDNDHHDDTQDRDQPVDEENQKQKQATKKNEGPKKMLELLSSATNSYLDDLDHELEQVEKFSLGYANKLGTLIKKNILEDNDDETISDQAIHEANRGDLGDDEAEILFNVPENSKTTIYATRTDGQLQALHTSQDLYITNAVDSDYAEFAKGFKIDEKTNDIAEVLKKHPELQNLMASLVPTKISYQEFWTRYYFMYGQILKQEAARKKLLQNNHNNDEGDFNWDDEEDEEEETTKKPSKSSKIEPPAAESRTSSELTYELKSTNSSTLDVVASKKSESKKEEEYDDDDDDWE